MPSRWVDRVPGARQRHSPNFDPRPKKRRIELVVVHGISLPPGEFGGPWIDRLFRNELPADAHPYFAAIAGLRVSTHLLVRRDGELVQYVSLRDRAWHAGQSRFGRRSNCNDFSIGIELEGTDEQRYTAAQYRRLADCVAELLAAHPGLNPRRVVGHSDIAPGRKTDPGPYFDWGRFYALLASRRRAIARSTAARNSDCVKGLPR